MDIQSRSLSAAFAALPPGPQRALENASRRRILRLTHEASPPLSPADMGRPVTATLSSITYYARVLWACNLLHLAEMQQIRGRVKHYFVSAVRDCRHVRSILAATKANDDSGP